MSSFTSAVVALVVLRDRAAEPRESPSWAAFHGWRSRSDVVRLGHRREALEDEAELDRHRLLAPQRAVVVEDGDALRHRHVAGDPLDELDDRLPGRRVVPGGQVGHVGAPARQSTASSFSTAWSIVKLAAFWRGGNSSNVVEELGRRSAVAASDEVGVVDEPVVVRVRRDVRPLERVGAQVEQLRDAQHRRTARPRSAASPATRCSMKTTFQLSKRSAEHVAVVGEVDEPLARARTRPRRSGRAAGCSRRCGP